MPRAHTYRESSGYACTLHRVVCFARPPRGGAPCGRRTVLHPVCPSHARAGLGLEVRRSGLPGAGCGLFTTRPLQKGDLIAPYLGARCGGGDTRCPHATRVGGGPRHGSPYAMDLDPAGRWQRDASCRRSYASMANHHPQRRRRNCGWFTLRLDAGRDFGPPDPTAPTTRALVTVPGYRSAPTLLRQAVRRADAGLNGEMVWLVARQRIPADRELFVDYGPQAAAVLAQGHRTEPPLC